MTPTLLGEIINDVVAASIRELPINLQTSWEKGLTGVAKGNYFS